MSLISVVGPGKKARPSFSWRCLDVIPASAVQLRGPAKKAHPSFSWSCIDLIPTSAVQLRCGALALTMQAAHRTESDILSRAGELFCFNTAGCDLFQQDVVARRREWTCTTRSKHVSALLSLQKARTHARLQLLGIAYRS